MIFALGRDRRGRRSEGVAIVGGGGRDGSGATRRRRTPLLGHVGMIEKLNDERARGRL